MNVKEVREAMIQKILKYILETRLVLDDKNVVLIKWLRSGFKGLDEYTTDELIQAIDSFSQDNKISLSKESGKRKKKEARMISVDLS